MGEIVSCGCDGSVRLWAATFTGPSSVALVAHSPLLLGSPGTLSPPLAGTTTPLVPSMVSATAGPSPRVGVLLEAAARQLVEGGLLVAPQLGSPASSDGSTGCWVTLRAREESPSAQIATRAVVPPSAQSKAFGIRTLVTCRPSGSSPSWSLSLGAHSLRWKRSWISAPRGAAHPPVARPLAARGWTSAAPLTF